MTTYRDPKTGAPAPRPGWMRDPDDTRPRNTIDTTGLPEYVGNLDTARRKPAEVNLGGADRVPPTPALADALAAEGRAADEYDEAAEEYREARAAREHADRDHETAVRAATRDGEPAPAAPKVDKLDQAVRNAGIVVEERARLLTVARTRLVSVARGDYPELRAAAVDQLDTRQAAVVDALQALRHALDARTEARTTVAALDSTYAEDWARTVAGMRKPTTGDGKPIAAEANILRTATSQRRAQVDHALRTVARELDIDKALRDAITDHAPENFTEKAAPATTEPVAEAS